MTSETDLAIGVTEEAVFEREMHEYLNLCSIVEKLPYSDWEESECTSKERAFEWGFEGQ